MRGIRILRYIGNREIPEPEPYDPVERMVQECVPLATLAFNDIAKFARVAPNLLLSDFEKQGDLWIKPQPFEFPVFSPMFHSFWPSIYGLDESSKVAPPEEVPFEVNMMEALIGWKAWSLENGVLHSASQANITWPVDEPLVAKCTHGCTEVPREHHTCGIYAANNREGACSYAEESEEFIGLVYGWGRYVRGGDGWRAQFAYPKCFYLGVGQVELIEKLKAYHVPIYIEQPQLIYNPEEEGYEYRGEEADGDCRTYQESFADEKRDSDEDED